MTVRNLPPIVRYSGDGTTTGYVWDWDMIIDSSINVTVDNINVTNWTLQDQTVVFDTAPADGAAIIIYRRTKLWQPENYKPFGWFAANKTELTMDRAYLIKQERYGDSLTYLPNGIVGGSNLSVTIGEYDLTVVSERGTDAVLPIYAYDDVVPVPPDPPDVLIIWEGNDISAGVYSLPDNTTGVSATITFRMDLASGSAFEASAAYPDYNSLAYASWLNADPNDDEYWMRVTEVSGAVAGRYTISDGTNNRVFGEAFQMRGEFIGPYVTVHTFGDVAPITRAATFDIEICKDLTGLPDGNWASRNVTLEAIFNLDTVVTPPPSTEGSVTWQSFFGSPFELNKPFYSATGGFIPDEGIAIAFTIPITSTAYNVRIGALEVNLDGRVFGAINQEVLNFVDGATKSWGLTGDIVGDVNTTGGDITLVPGQTYFFSVRREVYVPGGNYIILQASTFPA